MSRKRWSVPPRQIAPVALVLAATIAGVFGAVLLGDRDTARDSERRADVAAAQIRARVEQASSLADGLRRYMVDTPGRGVTSAAFASAASRWLSPAGFPAAAWVEEIPASRRAAYERRTGHAIVTRDRSGRIVPAASRSSYLPATLISGIPPMEVPAIDLGGSRGVAASVSRAGKLYDVAATPLTDVPGGTDGLFLVRLAPRLADGVVHQGFVVVFVSRLWLRAAATEADAGALRLRVGGAPTQNSDRVSATFTTGGRRFEVSMPEGSIQGAATVLPWIILAAGLGLAALVGALGVNATRRARAQRELDRIFRLSPDIIAVADFDGRFTRLNPAAEHVLGYSREELLTRPYVDFVHPDDRDRTLAEAATIEGGGTTLSFENRYLRGDGSIRVLEWTSTPVVEDRAMYAVARDVTERRQAEAELARLLDEQAALRRVATLVARGVPAAEVFSAVAAEVARLLDADATTIARLEPGETMIIVASSGRAGDQLPVGTSFELESQPALRADDRAQSSGLVRAVERRMLTRCTVAVPIVVEGSLWGAIAAGTEREQFPALAERRMTEFTELAAASIANAQSRSELVASRARVVAASDETRRKIERDLHDGAQQRLVHTVITLKLARQALEDGGDVPALVAEALDHAERATVELRELVHGILPPVLTRSGLRAAVGTLAARTPVPVENDVDVPRLSPAVEATAYFVVAEALTNVAKHADAGHATVGARVEDAVLRIRVQDDGVGGAGTDGHGFVGLADRLAALDGELHIESPAGGGTVVAADIPLRSQRSVTTRP